MEWKRKLTGSKFQQRYSRVNTIKKSPDSINLESIFETVAAKHGMATEPHAKSVVMDALKKTHKKFKAFVPGMTTDTSVLLYQ